MLSLSHMTVSLDSPLNASGSICLKQLGLDINLYTTATKIYGEIVKNLPELYTFQLDVVKDYEFEIEFAYLKNLSELTIYPHSHDACCNMLPSSINEVSIRFPRIPISFIFVSRKASRL
jgi:hypothetical protein